MENLSERSRNILKAIVQDYIRTAEPVSSKAVATRYLSGLSPATIRNIMAELETEGYLMQPHTSAGRVPTEKSFRFYVDTLLDYKELSVKEKELISRSFDNSASIDDILFEAARALSTLSSCAGIMFSPSSEGFNIKHINLVRLDSTGIMVILVYGAGLVRTKVIRIIEAEKLNLERITNYLNSIAKGLTIGQLRARIILEMQNEKNLYDELMANALRLGAMALEKDGSAGPGERLFVEGKANILIQPEFKDDFERMKRIFKAFEEKSLLVKILDKSLEDSGAHTFFGSQSECSELKGLSFVIAPCSKDKETLGTLGVIGPVRMDYSRIIPLVDYTAEFLGKVF